MGALQHPMKNKYQRMIRIMRQILRKMCVPFYLHTKSKHTFSVHQHIIMLVLRQYESKSYGSFVEWLQVSTEIVQIPGLDVIPHYTTLQKASARLNSILLHVATGRFIGPVCPGMIFAGADATGFEDGHAASYHMYRTSLRRSYTKLSAGSDMTTQPVCVVIQHHPIGHDVRHFPEILKQMTAVANPWIFVLDMGVRRRMGPPIHSESQDTVNDSCQETGGLSYLSHSWKIQKADEKKI
jgi:hypothetical protein